MHFIATWWRLDRVREFRRILMLTWSLTGGLRVDARVMYEIAQVQQNLPAIEPNDIPNRLREWDRKIQEMIPAVRGYARQLDVALEHWVQPEAGDPINHFDVLDNLTLETAVTLNTIDRIIGATEAARNRALVRLLIPVYWLIDVPALAVRWPWLILERAGLPVEYERNVVSNVLKVLLFLGYGLITIWLIGNKVSPDLVRALIPK